MTDALHELEAIEAEAARMEAQALATAERLEALAARFRGIAGAAAAPAAVAHRDPKPAKRPRREKAKRAPRARAAADAPRTEAAQLVDELERRIGFEDAVARFGFNVEVLRRWRTGAPCSPSSVARLRAALGSRTPGPPAGEEEAPGGEAAEVGQVG
jgi:hypothetical protein